MAAPLKDFRVPIPESVHLWLEAEASAFGVDMQDIVRGILVSWAGKKAKAFKIAAKRIRANGLQMDLIGDSPEDDGAGRK